MAYFRKQVYARVSNASGSFLKAWYNINLRSFTKTLNGGVGECIITLAVPFDYAGADLVEGNDVEVVVGDGDTLIATDATLLSSANTKTIYKGYISLIERDVDGATETVIVHVLGYYTLLSLDILKNGAQTTLYSINSGTGLTTTSGSNAAADIGLMVRGVIDRFNAEHGTGKVFYNASLANVPNTGTTAKYIFQEKTYREAIDVLKQLAPSNVYWYVDETGELSFKAVPTTPTYNFIFGRHFSKVHVERSLEKVRNVALVFNGVASGIYKHYEDAASIALYGRRAERITDLGVKDTGAADALGAKFLAENKDAGLILKCTIFDNNNDKGLGIDIEAIRPGQTCSITGFSSTLSNIFKDNMVITAVTYTLEAVEIQVEIVTSDLFNTQRKQTVQIAQINSGGLSIPDSYT